MAARQQPTSQNVTPAPEKPTYSDSSGAIFSMYIDRAQTFDKENVDNWDGQANGILLFTGLFSSTVASFIAVSYQNLQQDPNVTTQSLLAQISQQLSTSTTGGTTSPAIPSVQTSFTPAASVVFINSVWFLSLVLSLTCALMATLLQQWARRYLQMVQRNHAPHVRAHIREYFARGARRFGISWLVDVLPFLLLISILLFFAGLVVFAFRANHVVAYFTLSIVAFCLLSYLALTLTPLFSHDCPYHTPLTSLLWFCAHKALVFLFSTTHLCAKHLHEKWGAVSGAVVEFQNIQKNRIKSFPEGMISNLENSAKRISMEIYSSALGWTLSQLDEDHELENFAAGIPGLYESGALTTSNDPDDPHPTIHTVLSVLPGPTSFNEPLPWSIIGLAQRATASDLSETLRRQRIKACLKALYYIPGAIRDVLAPYAAGKHYCLVILPLLNTPESLEIIEELWDTPRDDVALSVRCVATVIAAFMITPPRRTLDIFLEDVPFIWDDDAGKKFLSKRLRLGASPGTNDGAVPSVNDNVVYEEDESIFSDASVDDAGLHNDEARLQNLGRFLADIGNGVKYMGMPWLKSDNAQPIHQERRALFDARNTEQYRAGSGISNQHGDRASPAFVRAAQQDLITLTLEILTRESVAGPTPLQFEAFHRAHIELRQLAGAEILSETLEIVAGPVNGPVGGPVARPVAGTVANKVAGTVSCAVADTISAPVAYAVIATITATVCVTVAATPPDTVAFTVATTGAGSTGPVSGAYASYVRGSEADSRASRERRRDDYTRAATNRREHWGPSADRGPTDGARWSFYNSYATGRIGRSLSFVFGFLVVGAVRCLIRGPGLFRFDERACVTCSSSI
ncbi:hypothetical protein H4582DRAFT_2060905 [Lactarius indigo]|nr:hypothetical protein H4582DRAFT_2060905 [Lactarius indigo]